LRLIRCSDSVLGRGEGDEEGVALGVDLLAGVLLEHYRAVLRTAR